MKPRQLLILLIIVLIVAAVGALVQLRQHSEWQSKRAGEKLCPQLDPAKISTAVIDAGTDKIQLRKKGNTWRVTQRYGYPANLSKLKSIVFNLANEKILRNLEVNEANYGRLDLAPPEQSNGGIKLSLKNEKGQLIEAVVFGKRHRKDSRDRSPSPYGSTGSARYLRVGNTVAMVGNTYTELTTDPSEWLHEYFLNTKDLKMAKLTNSQGDVRWKLERSDVQGDWKLQGFNPDNENKQQQEEDGEGEEGKDEGDTEDDDEKEPKVLDKRVISQVNRAFRNAKFEDVADPELSPEDTGLNNPKTFTAIDKDDIKYLVRIGKEHKGDQYYIKVKASYVGPEEAPEDNTDQKTSENNGNNEKSEEPSFQEKLEKRKDKVNKINDRLSDWTYMASVDSVLKDRSEFITEKDQAKGGQGRGQKVPANLRKKLRQKGGGSAPPQPPSSP